MELKNIKQKKFVLASQSPRRKEILSMVGMDFEISPSDYHEHPVPGATPAKLVEIHAREKALAVAKNYEKEFIIGADTIVIISGEILEKPQNYAHAAEMLRKLSGKTHEVKTGYAVVNAANKKIISAVATTQVTFYELSDDMITSYLSRSTYQDKAGSYAIQDFSGLFVKKINGCFYNVVGFPIAEFYRFLENNLHNIL